MQYLARTGWPAIARHDRHLMRYALRRFREKPFRDFITVYGPKRAEARFGVIAFTVSGVHSHDVATLLAEGDVCVRAGHHCAMPLHRSLGIAASTRLSFGLYNDRRDIDAFFRAFEKRVLPYARLTV